MNTPIEKNKLDSIEFVPVERGIPFSGLDEIPDQVAWALASIGNEESGGLLSGLRRVCGFFEEAERHYAKFRMADHKKDPRTRFFQGSLDTTLDRAAPIESSLCLYRVTEHSYVFDVSQTRRGSDDKPEEFDLATMIADKCRPSRPIGLKHATIKIKYALNPDPDEFRIDFSFLRGLFDPHLDFVINRPVDAARQAYRETAIQDAGAFERGLAILVSNTFARPMGKGNILFSPKHHFSDHGADYSLSVDLHFLNNVRAYDSFVSDFDSSGTVLYGRLDRGRRPAGIISATGFWGGEKTKIVTETPDTRKPLVVTLNLRSMKDGLPIEYCFAHDAFHLAARAGGLKQQVETYFARSA